MKTIERAYNFSVENLWANINTGFYNLDVRTEEVRATISKAERIYKIGVLATGEIREMSTTGHYYDGEAVTGERLQAIVAYIEKEGRCNLSMDANRITNVNVYGVMAASIA
jgi:hypothetical protein